ncbi:hypothetical protein [Gilvibacter sp.]|uniref:hypothetical protein n=1 Tax=Gilvibacter sp. TaxID=2729997 RepID=UPI0035BE4440
MAYYVLVLVIILEFIAASAGLKYIQKYRVSKITKRLVLILFFVAITELFSTYVPIAKASDFEYFGFVKGTPFEKNFWVHNIQLIITFGFFANYFRSSLKPGLLASIIKLVIIVFMIGALVNLLLSGVYFNGISKFTYIIGSILLLIAILVYYFELLRSDNILRFSQSLTFYISVGLLIYYLTMTPLFIYGSYYYTGESSDTFNKFYIYTLAIANVVMYGTFTLGFILCKPNQN